MPVCGNGEGESNSNGPRTPDVQAHQSRKSRGCSGKSGNRDRSQSRRSGGGSKTPRETIDLATDILEAETVQETEVDLAAETQRKQ